MQYNLKDINKIIPKTLEKNEFNICITSKSEKETKELAYIISKYLKSNDIVILNGELGSGKTAFMQGVAKYFDIEEQITSPTFTIVNEYLTKDNLNIYHFDVYRIEDEIEFTEQIGTDYFENGICFIEWGNIIQNILPKTAIHIDIQKDENDYDTRYINIWRKK